MFSQKNQTKWGYLFIAPGIIGLVLFNLGPMLFSFLISFTQWDIVTAPVFLGLDNYHSLISSSLVLKSLKVTLTYTMITVPMVTIGPLLVAQLLNSKIKGMSIFRTIFYIPSIVPMVANAAIWTYMYNPMYGPLNSLLKMADLPALKYIHSTTQVLPSLAVLAVWLSGNTVIIYLARLQDMPVYLYEAASLDGAGSFAKMKNITLPFMSPIIFFNLIMAVLGSMQTFTQAYIMTGGGPANSSLMYTMLVYNNAFKQSKMGYAAAMSWLLFLIMGVITLLVFASSKRWVFDGNEEEK